MPNQPALTSSNPLGSLDLLAVEGFTVFQREEFRFGPGLNVIVGENGAGKSHLLKLAYCMARSLYPAGRGSGLSGAAVDLGTTIAAKLGAVFLPDRLAHLLHNGKQVAGDGEAGNAGSGNADTGCRVSLRFTSGDSLSFRFDSADDSSVHVTSQPALPDSGIGAPIYLPTRELISAPPEFASRFHLFGTLFDQTYLDLALALSDPLPNRNGNGDDTRLARLVAPLEEAIGGKLVLRPDCGGRIFLRTVGGDREMTLLAEGQRKLAMLACLILNGSISRQGTVFWDEPETNLNPRLMVGLAQVLARLAADGVQVIIATHSLFMMREIAIQRDRLGAGHRPSARYVSLIATDEGVVMQDGEDIDDLRNIPALDAAIAQDEALERMEWDDPDA